LILILLAALVVSGIAAVVIGATTTAAKALIATLVLVASVTAAAAIGVNVGTTLGGCGFDHYNAGTTSSLVVVASLVGAIPGYYFVGIAIGYLSRRNTVA
jgi:hypothetical protein